MTKQTRAVSSDLTRRIQGLSAEVFSSEQRPVLTRMLRDRSVARCLAVNQHDIEFWKTIRSKQDWEQFCTPRIQALRQSLGTFPTPPRDLNVTTTGTVQGEGYCIENLVYNSRPEVFVTANLYLPQPCPNHKMPALLLVHSHHNPKTQAELQDMGMTWARSGCAVLVMDALSYGERRQHPAGPRQDYRFRYINGIQLHLIGESLMGWMVWDILRGIDLLTSRRDVDEGKVILIGAVAGGGDPVAVSSALDSRVSCAIPFNFGGPQPEIPYPLPVDPEACFNYMGSGSWESTRNLRLSGRDGFLPWVIVAAIAPRRLVYAHEFSWDRERDPVWKRLQRVYAFYDARENLAFTHGAGVLSGRPPEATHCNNVGQVHRVNIHHALQRWYGIPIPQEYQDRLPEEKLTCLPKAFVSRPLHEIYTETGSTRVIQARTSLARLSADDRRQRLRDQWAHLLGDVSPTHEPLVSSPHAEKLDGIRIESIVLETEPGILVPILLLLPPTARALVVGVAQAGKASFLTERAEEISALLKGGVAVCLPDVRGTGETTPSGSRGRQSEATAISATELMRGDTLLGARLRDLRTVLSYLRTRWGDGVRFGLWGESFSPTNPPDFNDALLNGDVSAEQSEPLGAVLALFGGLYETDVAAVVARGGIAGYQAVLGAQFCYVPHDVVVPGALTAGDLCDVAGAVAPRPLRVEGVVDGRNCLLSAQAVEQVLAPTRRAYGTATDDLLLLPVVKADLAIWLLHHLGMATNLTLVN